MSAHGADLLRSDQDTVYDLPVDEPCLPQQQESNHDQLVRLLAEAGPDMHMVMLEVKLRKDLADRGALAALPCLTLQDAERSGMLSVGISQDLAAFKYRLKPGDKAGAEKYAEWVRKAAELRKKSGPQPHSGE